MREDPLVELTEHDDSASNINVHSMYTYVVVVVVVSHIPRIGCQPEKNYFTRWPIPLVVC